MTMLEPGSNPNAKLRRRRFLKGVAAGAGVLALGPSLSAFEPNRPPYRGPNVILIRFGGGVRRRETIDPQNTYSPYLLRELAPRGTFFQNMEISYFLPPRPEIQKPLPIDTSHGQGTLYILSGKYEKYEDVGKRNPELGRKTFGDRFEPSVPTVFEYLRKAYDVPEHQTLIVNGEDRSDEEFYTFSNHHLFGVNYRSNVLSLFRYKTHLLRRKLAAGDIHDEKLRTKMEADLARMESLDYRRSEQGGQCAALQGFWDRWREQYGDSGFVNARGDRLLTELGIRALRELRPRLLMINYQDPDYVHWGNMTHYTRGIGIIDDGLKQLVTAVEADPEYRDNTVFVIVPDCGRDSNQFAAVPCQHHFGHRSSHEIWSVMFGPGIARRQVVDHRVDQISVAATIGHLMRMPTEFVEGPVLAEAMA